MVSTVAVISDFVDDYYHGVMKGVISSYQVECNFIDLRTNSSFSIIETAWILYNSIEYFPNDTIYLIVVDPGVGTSRKPLVVELGDAYVIVPDNGIISPLVDRITACYEIEGIPASSTFHGRDLFAPAVGKLLQGLEIDQLGQPVTDIIQLPIDITPSSHSGYVVSIDSFGNIVTSLQIDRDKGNNLTLTIGSNNQQLRLVQTFDHLSTAEVGVIIGSCGTLELVCNQGSAIDNLLDISIGDQVDLVSQS